jgi:outer membrane protein OmpA-like peptidoglycan-associated protein
MKRTLLAVTATAFLVSACTTDPYTGEQKVSNTVGGAGIGALAGAALGTLAGGAIGATMDRNEAELRQQLQGTGVSVTRNGDQIILNMPSDITFATDQDSVKAASTRCSIRWRWY